MPSCLFFAVPQSHCRPEGFLFLVSFFCKNYNINVGGGDIHYITVKEASEKWGVPPRRVNDYCADGRIPGAVKMAAIWLIPKDAEKPVDRRYKISGS